VPRGTPDETDRVIDVLNLTKRYGQNTVVDGLSFTLRSGAVTGFLGPNGAGKSTTMRMMLGLTRPDAGSARIGGRAYHELRYPARHVGALLENSTPHRSLTASHHLRWLAQSNRIARSRVGEVLEMVGLTGAARERVGTFSLGMSQRLGLAAALLGDPAVLVLDEPANGLDAEGIRWLRERLRAMAVEGRTVFVSSHLMTEMSVVADHLIVIHHGQLLADTSMSDFIQRHGRTYVRVRTPEPGLLCRELERKGASPRLAPDGSLEVDRMSAAEINRLAAANGLSLDELSTHTGSLEDIFLGLVGRKGGNAHG
jgi:ABC-2 type transport system ATP-binding protein